MNSRQKKKQIKKKNIYYGYGKNKRYKVKKKVIKRNKALCNRYPFLIPVNDFTGEPPKNYNYEWTELDNIPSGWRKAFGLQMVQEIGEELKKFDYLEEYSILQIKEKFGMLRWYDAGYPKDSKVGEIIDKYEELSGRTCLVCGKPGKIVGKYWLNCLCPKCEVRFFGR